jgi:pfkB family carbohydrate kinase
MKLLVIGHSVKDIIKIKNDIIIKPGGIFYSISTLINLMNYNDDEVYLDTSIEEKEYYLFEPAYSAVKKDFFENVDAIPKVNLMHLEELEREEIYENITDNLKLAVNDFTSFDGILINMITGFDIMLEQMKFIRSSFDGTIFFDVHTMSRGIDENYKRFFRRIPNFPEWAKCIDVLQVNQSELITLSDIIDEFKILEELFSYGVKIIIVTKDKLGARIFLQMNHEIISTFVSADKVEVKNKIGCGDVFGAVFFYYYIKTKNEIISLFKANKAAGFFVGCSGIKDLKMMKDYVFN